MSKADTRDREWFTYFDWIPLPSRITPEARLRQRQPLPFLLTLTDKRQENEAALAQFKLTWKGMSVRPDIQSIDLGAGMSASERGLCEAIEDWKRLHHDSGVAGCVDRAGLISVAISLDGNMPSVPEADWRRELIRREGQPESLAMLIVALLQSAIAEARVADSALTMLNSETLGVCEVKPLAVGPVPVDPNVWVKSLKGSTVTAGRVAQTLLGTRVLLSAQCEKTGLGGALTQSPSREAFISLSTRYGAVVDRTLSGIAAGTDSVRPEFERKRIEALTKRYLWGSLTLMAVFLATALIMPVWFPRDQFVLTKGEHAIYFSVFFILSVAALLSSFGAELETKRRRTLSDGSSEKANLGKRFFDEMLVRFAKVARSGGIYWAAALLAGVWILLGRDHGSDFPQAQFGKNTVYDSLKAAFWALPVVGMALLKAGYDNLSNRVLTLIDEENRLKILGEVENGLNLAQRFAVNIKAAFKNYSDAKKHPKEAAMLDRLLVFDNAKNDILVARRKIASDVDAAKASFARASAITAALGFLLVQQDVLGKMEPKSAREEKTEKILVSLARDNTMTNNTEKQYANNGTFAQKLAGLENDLKENCGDCSDALKLAYVQNFVSAWGQQSVLQTIEVAAAKLDERPTAQEIAKQIIDAVKKEPGQLGISVNVPDSAIIKNLNMSLVQKQLSVVASGDLISMTNVRDAVGGAFTEVGLEKGKLDPLSRLVPPIPEDIIDAIGEGVRRAFSNQPAPGVEAELQKMVKNGVLGALSEAGLARPEFHAKLNTLRPPLLGQFEASIKTAVKDALNDSKIADAIDAAQAALADEKKIQLKIEKFVEAAVKKSFSDGDSDGKTLAATLKSVIEERLKSEIKVHISSLSPEMGGLSSSLAGAILTAPVPCPDAKPGSADMSFAACLGITVSKQLPTPRTDGTSFVPMVPPNCKPKIGSMYFYKPNSQGYEYCRFEAGNEIWSDAQSCEIEPGSDFEYSGIKATALKGIETEILKKLDQDPNVLIVGLADSTGRPEQNMSLSSGRARLVKNHLLDTFPDMKKISAIGRGEEATATVSASEQMGLPAENPASRRADIYVCPAIPAPPPSAPPNPE